MPFLHAATVSAESLRKAPVKKTAERSRGGAPAPEKPADRSLRAAPAPEKSAGRSRGGAPAPEKPSDRSRAPTAPRQPPARLVGAPLAERPLPRAPSAERVAPVVGRGISQSAANAAGAHPKSASNGGKSTSTTASPVGFSSSLLVIDLIPIHSSSVRLAFVLSGFQP